MTIPPALRLFNLRSDPKEETDVKDFNPGVKSVIDKIVADFMASTKAFPNVPQDAPDPYLPSDRTIDGPADRRRPAEHASARHLDDERRRRLQRKHLLHFAFHRLALVDELVKGRDVQFPADESRVRRLHLDTVAHHDAIPALSPP